MSNIKSKNCEMCNGSNDIHRLCRDCVTLYIQEGKEQALDELQEWANKNNTIEIPNMPFKLARTDGGWINGLKLSEKIRQIRPEAEGSK